MVNLSGPETIWRARRLKLVLSDVDGVHTDAGVYYSAAGDELRRFNVRDGMGAARLRDCGLDVGFVSGEAAQSIWQRGQKLGLKHICLGVKDKRAHVRRLLEELSLSPTQVAYIGDDINDLGLMQWLAEHSLVAAPADAVAEVRRLVHFCTSAGGGTGAFREFADWLVELRKVEVVHDSSRNIA